MSSAVLCGKRPNFFDDLQSSPPVSKRIRCSSSSLSPPRSPALDHLVSLFPDMEKQLLEKALQECGGDIDSAIRSLNELHLGGSAEYLGSLSGQPAAAQEAEPQFSAQGTTVTDHEATNMEDASAAKKPPVHNAEWVELFVNEMMSATNVDDAKARASRALEVFERSVCAHVDADVAQRFQQENVMLKQQLEVLIHENSILKRAVSVQHERQKEFEDKDQELQNLRQLVAQYQDQLRNLEVNNYALAMHLKQAQPSNSFSGRFNPDVF